VRKRKRWFASLLLKFYHKVTQKGFRNKIHSVHQTNTNKNLFSTINFCFILFWFVFQQKKFVHYFSILYLRIVMKKERNIGDNIRLLREARGFSQKYMAEKLAITQQAYSSLEKKPEKTTLQRLKNIATILQVELITLLGEEDTFILQNFNQSGGNAATQMNITPSSNEHEIYNKLINSLKEEIVFLRELQLKK
jgi:transcriptional regulator with XRE-family HTH domain